MPALPNVPGVLRFDLLYIIGLDITARSRLFFHYTGGPPTNSDCAGFAADCRTLYGSHIAGNLADNVTLNEVKVTDLSSSSGGLGVDTTPVAGAKSGPYVPAQSCLLENKTIHRRYRGGKPRTYWPPSHAADLSTDQDWSGSLTGAMDTALAAFYGFLVADTHGSTTTDSEVNVSYYEGFVNFTGPTGRTRPRSLVRATPVVDTILSRIVVSPVASQRRRGFRHG